jgi:hypothetical protein
MSIFTDQQYLKRDQYKDGSNLAARVEIHRRFSTSPFEPVGSMFTLENGLNQLAPFFSQINVRHYSDNLCITDIELVIAYIRSTIRATALSLDELARIKQDLEKELQEKGTVFVQKDSGLFEAIK